MSTHKTIFTRVPSKTRVSHPRSFDKLLKRTAKAITKSKAVKTRKNITKFTKHDLKIMESLANRTSPSYPNNINEEDDLFFIRRYLDRIIMPHEKYAHSILKLKPDNNVLNAFTPMGPELDNNYFINELENGMIAEFNSTNQCCLLADELVESVDNYTHKMNNNMPITIAEIPLIFVLTDTNFSHVMLCIISGTVNKKNIYYPQRVFSIGLGMTNENNGLDSFPLSKRLHTVLQYNRNVHIDHVGITTPDKYSDFFGNTRAGEEYSYYIMEGQILTNEIVQNLKNELFSSHINKVYITKPNSDYQNEHISAYLSSNEYYCSYASEVYPNITGRNCIQFATSIVPDITAMHGWSMLVSPTKIRHKKKPPLFVNKLQRLFTLALEDNNGSNSQEFIRIIETRLD
jgi:hypothetical protein